MRKPLSLLVLALSLAGCRQEFPEQNPQQSQDSGLNALGGEYGRVLTEVAVLSYAAQPGDSIYTLLVSELQGAEEFVPLEWPGFALRNGVIAAPSAPGCRYDLTQILSVLNNRRFTPTTPLTVGEVVSFPDLNNDETINHKPGIYRGMLHFTGFFDTKGMSVWSEFFYHGTTYQMR